MASQIGESAGPVGQLASQFFTLGTQLGVAGLAVGALALAISGIKKLIELNNEAVNRAADAYKAASEGAKAYLKSVQKMIEDKEIENAHWSNTRIKLMEARLAYTELETALIAYQDRLQAEYDVYKKNTEGWKGFLFALGGAGPAIQGVGDYVEKKLQRPLEKTNPLLEELRNQIKELAKDKDKLDKGGKGEPLFGTGEESAGWLQKQRETDEKAWQKRVSEKHKRDKQAADAALKDEQNYNKSKLLYLDKVGDDIASIEEENYNRRIQIEQNALAIMEENERNTKAVMLDALTAFVDEGISGLATYLSGYFKMKALEAGADAIFATFKAIMCLASYQYPQAARWFSAAGTAAAFAAAYGAGSAITGAIGNASGGGGGAAAAASSRERQSMQGGGTQEEKNQSGVTNIYIYGHQINTSADADAVFYNGVENYKKHKYPGTKQTKI